VRAVGTVTQTTSDGAQFAADVRESLSREPRQLPSRYFYDPLGSALFDAICHLPWYRITRAESRLLASHGAELHQRLAPLASIVELGPGSGEKLELLLASAGSAPRPLDVHLVDVSVRALEAATTRLARLTGTRVVAHAAEYGNGLRTAAAHTRGRGRTLALFLGSNIGNFDSASAAALLAAVRRSLSPGDALLLGTDLIKPERELLLAYDDPLGVTAAFNRNLLLRINSELGGNFDLGQFTHHAAWNARDSRMEMHLVSRATQHVSITAVQLDFTLGAGDRIWTESSYKYEPASVAAMLEAAQFRTATQWIDDQDRFALTLAIADGTQSDDHTQQERS
jgi:L-histidine Nalpha-methyltransferase